MANIPDLDQFIEEKAPQIKVSAGEMYGNTIIDFPIDTPMDEIEAVMSKNFPDPKAIYNPDGSAKIDTRNLIVQPTVDPKDLFSVMEKAAYYTQGLRQTIADRAEDVPAALRGETGKFPLATDNPENRALFDRVVFEASPSRIADASEATPALIAGFAGFVVGTAKKVFDTSLKLMSNFELLVNKVTGSKKDAGPLVERMANLTPDEIDKSGDKLAEVLSSLVPEPKSPEARDLLEFAVKPFEIAEEEIVENVAEGYAKLFGKTKEEKENIRAWVRITGDVALLALPETAKTIKRGKAARNVEKLVKEVEGAAQADAKALLEEGDAAILKEARDRAEAEKAAGLFGEEPIAKPKPKPKAKPKPKVKKKSVLKGEAGAIAPELLGLPKGPEEKADKTPIKPFAKIKDVPELEPIVKRMQKGDATVLKDIEKMANERGIEVFNVIGDAITNTSKKFEANIREGYSELNARMNRKLSTGIGFETLIKDEKGSIDVEAIKKLGRKINPFVLDPQKPSILRPTKLGANVVEMNKKRTVDINEALYHSELFVRDVTKGLTKAEREAIPFIIEKTTDTSLLSPEIAAVVKNPSEKVQRSVARTKRYYKSSLKWMRNQGIDINFVDDYVNRIWDLPKNKRAETVNFFTTKNPHAQKRTIPSLVEGMKSVEEGGLGLTLKTSDIGDLLRAYDQYKIKTVHNKKYAEQLAEMKNAAGEPVILPFNKAPKDWVEMDVPALNKAVFVGKTKGGASIVATRSIKVDPEIALELKAVFGKGLPRDYGVIPALQGISAYVKKSVLSLSFFHTGSLTEAAIASRIGLKAIKLWNPVKVYDAIKNGNYEIFKQQKIAADSIRHGVTYGALSDVQRSRIQRDLFALQRATADIPGIKHLTKGLNKFNEIWDKGLWDYYHNTLKLMAYETNVKDAIRGLEKDKQKTKGTSLSVQEISAIKDNIGDIVNAQFGGQNWDVQRVLGHPKMKEALQLLFLSPDWQVSTMKQAFAPLTGAKEKIKVRGQEKRGEISSLDAAIQTKGAEALTRQGNRFWLRALTYFTILGNILNYANTADELGEGRYLWDNPPGSKMSIFWKKNRNDQGVVVGPDIYVSPFKQFKEPYKWLSNPLTALGSKVNPVIQEGARQVFQVDIGSSFPAEFRDKEGLDKIIARGKSLATLPIPFSLKSHVDNKPGMFMLMFPTRAGLSKFSARKLFKTELEKEKVDLQEIRKIRNWAFENNLDAETLFNEANAQVKRDITMDDKSAARDFFQELLNVPDDQKKPLMEEYGKRGTVTPGVKKEIIKLIKEHDKIQQGRKALDLQSKKGPSIGEKIGGAALEAVNVLIGAGASEVSAASKPALNEARKQIISDEGGLKTESYLDSVGKKTIGIGRNLADRPLTPEERKHIGATSLSPNKLTTKQAEQLFEMDFQTAVDDAHRVIPKLETLSSARQAVLINMAFNLGRKRLSNFKNMLVAINKGDFDTAALEMLDSKWAKQVKGRALRLAEKMRKGK